jgi:hypothetical protein
MTRCGFLGMHAAMMRLKSRGRSQLYEVLVQAIKYRIENTGGS